MGRVVKGKSIQIDMTEYENFFKKLSAINKARLCDDFKSFFESLGKEFLDVIQQEIIKAGSVDTGRMLALFEKGADSNIWTVSDGGLTLTVGTEKEYAVYVNYGHGTGNRFVPGYWSGGRFFYQPGADTGMVLHGGFVEGSHYWESGIAIIEKMFPKLMGKAFEKWMHDWMKKL